MIEISEPTAKTKRRRRKEHRPGEIRQAALEELREKGLAGSTFQGIARRAGISRTTVYLYFNSKMDIFEAVARDTMERALDEAAQAIVEFEGSYEQLFEKVIDRLYDQLVAGDARYIFKVMVAEGHDHSEIVAFYHREIFSKGEATLRSLISAGVESGALGQQASGLDPRTIIAPAIFAGIWSLIFSEIDPMDVEKFKRDHASIFLRGLLKREDEK